MTRRLPVMQRLEMVENSSALLTIIVPAYNVEKYIAECLDSMVHQTVQNHKVIIVNDGSTDGTEEICKTYQEKYPELISYVYQENKGSGGARNTGIEKVETPYLCFLDSDDWLNVKYVERLTELLKKADEQPDMVFTLPWVYDSVTKRINPWMDKWRYDRVFAVNGNETQMRTNARKSPELYALEVNPCRKIYKRAFLTKNQFHFPEQLKWEDVPGHFYLLHRANTCMALPDVGFFYRVNQGGQITSGTGKGRMDMLPIFQQLLDIQEKECFRSLERAYVIRLIAEFSSWSIDVVDLEYMEPLLKGLHEIYQGFQKEDIEFYLERISGDKERDRGLIYCLIGEQYLKLSDYETREKKISECCRKSLEALQGRQKKGIVRGGIQCVCDHGVSYTAIWMVRKYLLRQRS